jgi:transposase
VRSIMGDGSYRGSAPFDDKGRIRWEGGERTFTWLGNFRRLARDYEKSLTMAKAMILLAAICITPKN